MTVFRRLCKIDYLSSYTHAGRYYTLYEIARFDEDEVPEFVYHYQETTPWGKGRSNEANYRNYMECQAMLRERGLCF